MIDPTSELRDMHAPVEAQRGNLRPNGDLIVVQARLFSPSLWGDGRWVIVDTASRVSYLAMGKDCVPPVVAELHADCGGGDSDEPVSDVQRKLIGHNLLNWRTERQSLRSFVSAYHNYVFDYPFFDYADPEWRRQDQARMRAFAEQGPPPSKYTERVGARSYTLPNACLELLTEGASLMRGLDASALANILRFSLGAIGSIPAEFGPWLRKTSPSGGARHPTEAIVHLPDARFGIPIGSYFYDPKDHRLVSGAETFSGSLARTPSGTIGISLTSRVERPMWRYREPRSFRPILFDAGHVAETVALLANMMGLSVWHSTPAAGLRTNINWIDEPELRLMIIAERELKPNIAETTRVRQEPPKSSASNAGAVQHLTNPFLYYTFGDNGLLANVVWPTIGRFDITLSDFLMLNHALPSRRGDRATDAKSIVHVAGSSLSRVRQLVDQSLLLERSEAEPLYAKMRLWTRHSWYLPLLAYAETMAARAAVNSGDKDTYQYYRETPGLNSLSPTEKMDALMTRKTARAFVDRGLRLDVLLDLLRNADVKADELATPSAIYVGALNVIGLPSCSIHDWNKDKQQLQSLGKTVTREQIADMTIGQHWSSTGSAVFWLMQSMTERDPAIYCETISWLGNCAQRICVLAEFHGLGVFLTPAVHDVKTSTTLGIGDARHTLFYFLEIGTRATKPAPIQHPEGTLQ